MSPEASLGSYDDADWMALDFPAAVRTIEAFWLALARRPQAD